MATIVTHIKNMAFRDNLRLAMEFSDVRSKELAAKTGIKLSTLKTYLGSQAKIPSAETAVRLAQALGVSVEYLVTGESAAAPAADLPHLCREARATARLVERLDAEGRVFALDFMRWLAARQETAAAAVA